MNKFTHQDMIQMLVNRVYRLPFNGEAASAPVTTNLRYAQSLMSTPAIAVNGGSLNGGS